jgi:L-fuculose-phosphate aldolase
MNSTNDTNRKKENVREIGVEKSTMSDRADRAQLQHAGRYLLDHDLTWGNSGNLSARTVKNPNHYLITASGTQLGNLGEDDFVECPITFTEPPFYPRKPSKEMPMHAAVYESRPEINAVLHASPFYSTLIACSDIDVPGDLFVENMYYLERVGRVRYCHPGSAALGEAVREQAAAANVLLLENHGVLVYDTSVAEALMALHTLELVCQMVITARSAGFSFHHLPADTVTDFLTNAGYRPRRRWSLLKE